MSNLPPGVTGNEFEIAGPDFEEDMHRECRAPNVTVKSVDQNDRYLKAALDALVNDNVTLARSYIHQARADIVDNDFDECPFIGIVTVSGYRGQAWWECPLCRTQHDEED